MTIRDEIYIENMLQRLKLDVTLHDNKLDIRLKYTDCDGDETEICSDHVFIYKEDT